MIKKIISIILILVGVYGIVACGLFYKDYIFNVSEETATEYYESRIKPEVDERISKLNLEGMTEAEQSNLRKIVQAAVFDHTITNERIEKYHVMLLSIIVSLFSILLGIVLWSSRKVDKKTYQTVS